MIKKIGKNEKIIIAVVLYVLLVQCMKRCYYSQDLLNADRLRFYQNRDLLCTIDDPDLVDSLFEGCVYNYWRALGECWDVPEYNDTVRSASRTRELLTIRFYRGHQYLGRLRIVTPKKILTDADGNIVRSRHNLQNHPVVIERVFYRHFDPQFYEAVEEILEQQQIVLQ